MNVYAKQKLEQKESGCGGAATELFKQINQYQRGRKFTASHGTTEREREREREREKKISPGSIRADLANFFKVVCQFIIFQFSGNFHRAHVRRLQASLLFCFFFFVLHARCLETEFGSNQPRPHPLKKLLLVSLLQNYFYRVNMHNTFYFRLSIPL